jgi:RNA polymerase sigma-70 factor (ECF subfamily)
MGNRHDAEDIVQDMYVSILSMDDERKCTPQFAWTTARNRMLDVRKTRITRARLDVMVTYDCDRRVEASPETTISARQQLSIVNKALQEIPDRCVKALLSRVLDGNEFYEIAKEHGVSVRMAQYYMRDAAQAARAAVETPQEMSSRPRKG